MCELIADESEYVKIFYKKKNCKASDWLTLQVYQSEVWFPIDLHMIWSFYTLLSSPILWIQESLA